jgi:NADP-dependent 3-hydroxy acid dehydrogenase YdfG
MKKIVQILFAPENKEIADAIAMRLSNQDTNIGYSVYTQTLPENADKYIVLVSDNFLKNSDCIANFPDFLAKEINKTSLILIDGIQTDPQGLVKAQPTRIENINDVMHYRDYWYDKWIYYRKQRNELQTPSNELENQISMAQRISNTIGSTLRAINDAKPFTLDSFSTNAVQNELNAIASSPITFANVPKVEIPTVEIPKVEIPTVELPKVEIPKVEIPTVELPKVEIPTVELPKVEIPTVELPKVEIPTVELPKVEIPTVELPKVEIPTVDLGLKISEEARVVTTTIIQESVQPELVVAPTAVPEPVLKEEAAAPVSAPEPIRNVASQMHQDDDLQSARTLIEIAKNYYQKAYAHNPELRTDENDAYFGIAKEVQAEAALPVNTQKVLTVLITGATSGIGLATAERLASEGHRLILTGRRADRMQIIVNHLITRYQAQVCPLIFDIRSPQQIAEALTKIPTEFSQIDVLINNAGLAKGFSTIDAGQLDHWNAMIDTNIKGLLYITRAISPQMIKRQSGHIINLSSTAGREVYPKGNVYCASKFAVDALNKAMRFDLYTHNIRVTGIYPAHTEDTEFALVRFDGDKEKSKIYQDFQPLKAQDVAEAIAFAISRPDHVNINEIVLSGSQQASPTLINRSGRPDLED